MLRISRHSVSASSLVRCAVCPSCQRNSRVRRKRRVPSLRHPGHLWREPLYVLGFLLQQSLRDEDGEVRVHVAGGLEARVQPARDALPEGETVGPDDHHAAHRRVVGQFRPQAHRRVPVGEGLRFAGDLLDVFHGHGGSTLLRPNKYTPPGGTGCARGTTLIPAPSAVPALSPGHGGFPARPRLRLTLGSEVGFGAARGPGSHSPRIARPDAGAYAPSSSPKYPYLYQPGSGPSMRAARRDLARPP